MARKKTMKEMKREIIEFCVDVQIEEGIVDPKNRELQIRSRLKGYAGLKPMTYDECVVWYQSIVAAKAALEN